MKLTQKLIIPAAILATTFSSFCDAGNSTGLRLAAASTSQPALSITAKKSKCVTNVAGTKWKGTKFYQGGGSSNFTIMFNGGGAGTEVGVVPTAITWQQFAKTVKWLKPIEDAKVDHKVQLKCNKMAGRFNIYDISGPLMSSGTVKMKLIN
ncbi:MAG: hypothetical protein ACI8P9_004920 [Parasphingorhabdus sp.]|jgi:hypothetical protein